MLDRDCDRAHLNNLSHALLRLHKALTVSQSLYLMDPDRNEVEFYVDADESVWKKSPAVVVSPIKPLNL